jgi:hypothetical protein
LANVPSKLADRTGDGRRLGENIVARHRHPISAGRGDAAHRHHDRNLPFLGRQQRLADSLGCGGRPAGAVDAHYQRLQILGRQALFDHPGNGLAAGAAGAGLAVDDLTGDGDHADRARVHPDRLVLIGGKLDALIAAGTVLILAAKLGQPRLIGPPLADPVDQLQVERRFGKIAIGGAGHPNRVGD